MAATARPARKEPKVRNQRALGIRGTADGPVPVPALQGEGGAQRATGSSDRKAGGSIRPFSRGF
jgi:hypothetical protein